MLNDPVGLARVSDGWLVSSAAADKVLKFGFDGSLIDANFISSGSGGLDAPVYITVVPVPEVAASSCLILGGFCCLLRRRRR